MGGASLYLWLTLLCVIAVLCLFGIGWVLVRLGRRQEARRRQLRRSRPRSPEQPPATKSEEEP